MMMMHFFLGFCMPIHPRVESAFSWTSRVCFRQDAFPWGISDATMCAIFPTVSTKQSYIHVHARRKSVV